MGRFPKYNLSEKQIKGIANVVLHEQGSISGWYAEASQIANRTDIKGDIYATPTNAVKTVCSGWYAKGKTRYNAGTNNSTVIKIVKRVFLDGYRTLPRYIDEHDCMSDISTAKNGTLNVKSSKSKWIKHVTKIHNRMGSNYIFYSFPGGYKTGVDPFGYTSTSYRKKWGDFCYTVDEAEAAVEEYNMPTIKKGSKGLAVKVWEVIIGAKVDGTFGDETEKKTKEFQKKHKLTVDGVVGKFTWAAGLSTL